MKNSPFKKDDRIRFKNPDYPRLVGRLATVVGDARDATQVRFTFDGTKSKETWWHGNFELVEAEGPPAPATPTEASP